MGQNPNVNLNQWQCLCIFLMLLMVDSVVLANQKQELRLVQTCREVVKPSRARKERLKQTMLLVRDRLKSQNLMERLGLEPGASVEDLKRAYHSM